MLWAASSAGTSWDTRSNRKLRVPWPELARILSPRGGQVMMLLAAPGVGKTAFAVNLAAQSGEKTLYVSADTDAKLMSLQLACLATGDDREAVESRLEASAVWRGVYVDSIRKQFPNLVMDFSSAPRFEDVAQKAEALCEVWGVPPKLVVLDTASDVQKRGDDFPAWQDLWLTGRDFSRFFNCVVLFAHHVSSGPAASGDVAPKQSDGMYKADQFAEMVVGLHRDGPEVCVSVLKNRGGKSRVPVWLVAEHDRALLRERTPDERLERVKGISL